MKIRLTRKFADVINGVDISKAHEGETLDLSQREAEILLAEGWAEYEGGAQPRDTAHEAERAGSTRRRSKRSIFLSQLFPTSLTPIGIHLQAELPSCRALAFI